MVRGDTEHTEGGLPISPPLRLTLALMVAIGALGGSSERAFGSHPIPSATVVQSDLLVPWDLAFSPDGRMFVTERPGRVRVYASGAPGAALLGQTPIEHVRAEHEAGANGIAIDRDFVAHPSIYVCVTRDADGATG